MKVLLAILLISLTGCVTFDKPWSKETRVLETTYQVVHAADAIQTMQVYNNPNVRESQSAWILGSKPTPGKVWVWYFVTAYGHSAITDALEQRSPPWVRRTWQVLTLGDAVNAVYGNYQLGLKIGF